MTSESDERELHIGESGLWVPPEVRDFDRQIVFRTPRATIQHFGSGEMQPYYGMIDASHFNQSGNENVKHPELLPNYVSIKPEGEEKSIHPVNIDPEVRL